MTDLPQLGPAVAAAVGLVLLVAVVNTLSRRLGAPAPILLVVAGVIVSLVPGVPAYRLQPELVLTVVLPLLLFAAAFNTSLPAFRANLRPIGLLSVGLTLFSTVAIGFAAYALIPGLPLAAGLVLGAVVSPPDAVAATAVARRIGMPRRVVTVLEGESLFNDAAGLTAYRVAVAATVSGSFTLLDAAGQFVVATLGGLAVGLVVAFLVALVRTRLSNPLSDITLGLVTPFLAYLPAQAINASGLVAVVVTGLYLGYRAPRLTDAAARLVSLSVWKVIAYLLEGLVFVLIGLQLSDVVANLHGYSAGTLTGLSAGLVAVVVASRFAWVFATTYLPRLWRAAMPGRRALASADPWQIPALVSWSGMRGVVSLAAAFALPLATNSGAPFPQRSLLLFLTFVVIVVTLLGHGLTLPVVVRRLHVPPPDPTRDALQEAAAQQAAATAALERLDALLPEQSPPPWIADRLRAQTENRRLAAWERLGGREDSSQADSPSAAYRRLRRAMLDAERREFVQLRDAGRLDDEVFRKVLHELDLEESTLLRE